MAVVAGVWRQGSGGSKSDCSSRNAARAAKIVVMKCRSNEVIIITAAYGTSCALARVLPVSCL